MYIESPPEMPMAMAAAGPHGQAPPPPLHKLKASRAKISNQYAKIPFHIMADFALKSGIKLKNKFKLDEKIPKGLLTQVFATLKSYAQSNGSSSVADHWLQHKPPPWLPALRHGYLHFSAHYERSAVIITAHKPHFIKGLRKRKVFGG